MPSDAGRYERLRAIASGGMATVYLGRALGVGGFERMVAIKVMHQRLALEPQFVAMFLDEARLAARIRHPNVVSTLDVQADDEGVFLVMDYVEGPSLYALLRRLRKSGSFMPIPVALKILVDVLAGLHAAHDLTAADGAPLNLVHRDVSPQNIIVGIDGVTRLTDFGIARAESRLAANTQSGELKGKLGYMSNEQLRAQPVDRRADVYSAGVVLWELLAGKRLFDGDNDAAIALAAATGPTHSPRQVNPEVPSAVDEVVMRALARAPADRHPDAAAFSDALEQAGARSGVLPASAREMRDFLQRMDDEATTQIDRGELAKKLRFDESRSLDGDDEIPTLATDELPTARLEADAPVPGAVPSTSSRPVAAPDSPPDYEGPRSERSISSPTAGGASLPSEMSPPAPDKRTRWVAAIAVALLAGTLLVYASRSSEVPAAEDAAPARDSRDAPAAAAPTPEAPAPSVAPQPAPPASTAPAPAAGRPSADATAPATPTHATRRTKTPKAPPKPPPAKPAPTATTPYRPKGI